MPRFVDDEIHTRNEMEIIEGFYAVEKIEREQNDHSHFQIFDILIAVLHLNVYLVLIALTASTARNILFSSFSLKYGMA